MSAFLFFCLLPLLIAPVTPQQGEGAFVEKLGEELWQLSQLVTKYAEITAKYKSLNARVDTNDGRNLTGQIVENVNRMLEERTQAAKCIQEAAEDLILESNRTAFESDDFALEYHSMQFSGVDEKQLGWAKEPYTTYLNMTLQKNDDFHGIPVNTEYSAVHIPTNLYDRYPDVAEAITWSTGLNETFVRNLRSNPELSWQYYGAASGMMRQYPAMRWHAASKGDLYDCRTRDWFIEAATCSKDVVILMDNSGSMTGMRNTIAKLVVNKLLTTFSNNDFVNVLNFSWTASPVLPCFDDLVQANEENIHDLQAAVSDVKPSGNASVPSAFEAAFALLKNARERRGCEQNSSDCQQAIMLVTDGLPENITDVFERLNRLPDGTPIVRVFTYLLGREVRGVLEIQDIACDNRGYYVHITDMDQVQDQVLKYMAILARPLALQADEHPIRWSHLFSDIDDGRVSAWLRQVMSEPRQQARLARHLRYLNSPYFSQQQEDAIYMTRVHQVEGEEKETIYQEYRMMTAVSVPVFDTREIPLNETKFLDLLAGVAGTDVPISDIYSLTYPYKIGANGYAFILTNNGHILMHPDHRPVHKGFLKRNYNSIDLLDVEFAADEDGEEKLEMLRDLMVQNEETGDIQNVMVRFHYDDMRRVGVEKRDYYFQPLDGTPFSLGLAIPADYGDYQIGVKDMVNERFLTTSINPLETYFTEPEWRIHPEWTYCKYRYMSGHSFNSSEEELLDILRKLKTQKQWKDYQMTLAAKKQSGGLGSCNEPPVPEDEFYCDPDLLILLIFDAGVTNDSFRDPVTAMNNYQNKLLKTYNSTLRFVATQSGLTRWQKIPKPAPSDPDRGDFGDIFPRAIHEPWFKAAVLQYNLDTRGGKAKAGDSFVFSVPYDAGELPEIPVMAAISIFPRDGGRIAPASVVGYQLTYDSFEKRFHELSANYSVDCYSEDRLCYVIDHNAYVVLSHSRSNIGRTFAKVEPEAMEKLLEVGLYREIEITDYQAIIINVTREDIHSSATTSPILLSWSLTMHFLSWVWTHIFLTWTQTMGVLFTQVGSATVPVITDLDDDDDEEDDDDDDGRDYSDIAQRPTTMATPKSNATKKFVQRAYPAHATHYLYLLEQSTSERYKRDDDPTSRLVSARRIQHTNLMLLVIDRLPKDKSGDFNVTLITEANISQPTACLRYERTSNLTRRRIGKCVTSHPKEEEIDACGGGGFISSQLLLFAFLLLLPIFTT